MSLVDLLKHALLDLKASWVMWILLVLSVVDLIIIGERALFLFWVRDDVAKLSADLDKRLREGKVREALEGLEKSPSSEAAVVGAGFRHPDPRPGPGPKGEGGTPAPAPRPPPRRGAGPGTGAHHTPLL